MSLYEYDESKEISQRDHSFYALIMAAMRKADDNNIELLKEGWPEVWEELEARYNAPDGLIKGETNE